MKTKRALVLGALALATATGQTASRAAPAEPGESRPPTANDVERLQRSADDEGRRLEKRLREIGKESQLADARLTARGRAYVALARVGLLPVGSGFDALLEHAARLERLHHGLEEDLALGKRLAAERLTIAKKLDAVRARAATLEDERAVLSRAAEALRSAEEREQAFAQAFQSDNHTAVYGAVGPADPTLTAVGFAALRGRLPFPLAGRTEVQPARRASSEGPGLELRAPLGTVVRSVAAGRVAFADTYADYGKTIILDHGRRHYTVSANLDAIDVEVGDEIAAGARLGTVGDTGKGPRLYFEIRVGRDTVDPAPWFGL